MALNMSNATNARSVSAIKTLATNYENDVKKVVNTMKGENYNNLKNTIKAYWAGADCDNFLKQLDNRINELQKEISNCTYTITNALNQELSDYKKFQQGNTF